MPQSSNFPDIRYKGRNIFKPISIDDLGPVIEYLRKFFIQENNSNDFWEIYHKIENFIRCITFVFAPSISKIGTTEEFFVYELYKLHQSVIKDFCAKNDLLIRSDPVFFQIVEYGDIDAELYRGFYTGKIARDSLTSEQKKALSSMDNIVTYLDILNNRKYDKNNIDNVVKDLSLLKNIYDEGYKKEIENSDFKIERYENLDNPQYDVYVFDEEKIRSTIRDEIFEPLFKEDFEMDPANFSEEEKQLCIDGIYEINQYNITTKNRHYEPNSSQVYDIMNFSYDKMKYNKKILDYLSFVLKQKITPKSFVEDENDPEKKELLRDLRCVLRWSSQEDTLMRCCFQKLPAYDTNKYVKIIDKIFKYESETIKDSLEKFIKNETNAHAYCLPAMTNKFFCVYPVYSDVSLRTFIHELLHAIDINFILDKDLNAVVLKSGFSCTILSEADNIEEYKNLPKAVSFNEIINDYFAIKVADILSDNNFDIFSNAKTFNIYQAGFSLFKNFIEDNEDLLKWHKINGDPLGYANKIGLDNYKDLCKIADECLSAMEDADFNDDFTCMNLAEMLYEFYNGKTLVGDNDLDNIIKIVKSKFPYENYGELTAVLQKYAELNNRLVALQDNIKKYMNNNENENE